MSFCSHGTREKSAQRLTIIYIYILFHQKRVSETIIVNNFIKYLIKKNKRQKQLKVVLPEWILSKILKRVAYLFDTEKTAKFPKSTTFSQ